ncbi:hypothetical protein ACI79G_04320 [Geodermatophilus sp. SYSU D00779]
MIASRYRLGEHDAGDVGQVVWMRLVEQVQRLREPRALPGWIATTAVARASPRPAPTGGPISSTRWEARRTSSWQTTRTSTPSCCRMRWSRPCARVSPNCPRPSATCSSWRPTLRSATRSSAPVSCGE